jgi:hypothetical protein
MCVFAYKSRVDKPICPKLGKLISCNQEEILELSIISNKTPRFESRLRVFSVNGNLSKIEERREDQTLFFFGKEIRETGGKTPKEVSGVS